MLADSSISTPLIRLVEDLHGEPQALQFFDQHLEGFRHTRFQDRIPLHNRFVGLDPAHHIITLDGEQLLQDVRGAIGFQRPHFHFPKPLATRTALCHPTAAA